MKPNNLILKIYGEHKDNQWSLISLDFSLAAQADTLEEASAILQSQIKEYLIEALNGQDKEFSVSLLRRKAPLKYWVMWWFGTCKFHLFNKKGEDHRAINETLNMIPA